MTSPSTGTVTADRFAAFCITLNFPTPTSLVSCEVKSIVDHKTKFDMSVELQRMRTGFMRRNRNKPADLFSLFCHGIFCIRLFRFRERGEDEDRQQKGK